MALIHYEHFELYGTFANLLLRGYATTSAQLTLQNSGARTGTHCLSVGSNADRRLDWFFPAPLNVVGQGCAIIYNNLPDAGFLIAAPGLRFGVAGDGNFVRIQANNSLGISVYENGTLRGSSANGIITLGAWFWLEARVTSGAGTVGAVEVRVNGVTVLTVTGLSWTNQFVSAGLGQENTQAVNVRWDDWVVWDTTGSVNNTFMGDTFVIVAPPNADGATNQWVASTGTARWDMIDEATPNDADFIRGDNVGDVNVFDHVSPLLPSAGAIAAVAVQARALKTDAGASSIELGVEVSAGNTMSSAFALNTSAVVRSHIANLNPDGGIPWTQTTAQAARLRVRRAA